VISELVPQIITASSGDMGMELPYSISDVLEKNDFFLISRMLGGADLNTLNEKLKQVPVKIRVK
jgi:hypothetical protein